MVTIELPCGIGDTAYYTTEWDKYGIQESHIVKVSSITILEKDTIFHTGDRNLLLSNYKRTWFTNKIEWEKECEVLRETHKYEQQLRKSKGDIEHEADREI